MSRSRQRPTEETIRRRRFGLRVQEFGLRVQEEDAQEEDAAVRGDPDAWADYLAEAELSHTTDGID